MASRDSHFRPHCVAGQGFLKRKTTKMDKNQNLEDVLESAVIANWADLMRGAKGGLIPVEYGFVPAGTLDHVQVWSSITRGHWLLICEYRMSASNSDSNGLRFANGYHSEGLANILDFVMQRQNMFTLPTDIGRPGLLQIPRPTEAEVAVAAASVRGVFDHVKSALAEPVLA